MNNIIGVCVTLTHAEITRECLGALHKVAEQHNYKLLVFNSNIDFKYRKSKGAESIYHMIPYQKLDALIIFHDTIHDVNIRQAIIKGAKNNNVPVIFARSDSDEYLSVSGRYEEAFSKMINSVLDKRTPRRVFFISGRRNMEEHPESDSSKRYFSLRNILEERGIPFGEDDVDCGEYWENPTIKIIDRLINDRDNLPDILFCANDVMALAASKRLMEYGVKIPQEVMVTGFDGLECSQYAKPRLTTCKEDLDTMSQLLIKDIEDLRDGKEPEMHSQYDYKVVLSESCGFNDISESEKSASASIMYNRFRINDNDDENSSRWLESMIEDNRYQFFIDNLPVYLEKLRTVYLRKDDAFLKGDQLGEEYYELPDDIEEFVHGEWKSKDCTREDIFDRIEDNLDIDNIGIVSAIYVKNLPMGIYFEKVKDILNEGHLYHRHVQVLNRALLGCLTGERNIKLKETLETNKFRDSLTDFYNLRGLQRWYEKFSDYEDSHEKYVAVCVFSFMNHDEIINHYGIEVCETCVKYIGKRLKQAHPEESVLAKISNSGFVVVLTAGNNNDRAEYIYSAVGKFYESIMNFNNVDPEGPQMEISSGSVDLNPGWEGALNVYIEGAYDELYKNRLAMYSDKGGDYRLDIKAELEVVNMLNIIIKENKLRYFFQPIVDVCTGEIVAYEALMRTTGGIDINPLQLLDLAKRHRRLYDIEKLTMFNVFENYKNKEDEFKDRLIFINTIPGRFLNEEDVSKLRENYSKYFKNAVIEITEDDSLSNDELIRIRKCGGTKEEINIAVDDYGTGHSNIVNLFNYKPQVVKIDRFLITDIQNDHNKQMFVSNVISFARANDIRVLAEGVETSEELQTVINLGIDLIQGYYTAKPAPEILQELPSHLKEEIIMYAKERDGRR